MLLLQILVYVYCILVSVYCNFGYASIAIFFVHVYAVVGPVYTVVLLCVYCTFLVYEYCSRWSCVYCSFFVYCRLVMCVLEFFWYMYTEVFGGVSTAVLVFVYGSLVMCLLYFFCLLKSLVMCLLQFRYLYTSVWLFGYARRLMNIWFNYFCSHACTHANFVDRADRCYKTSCAYLGFSTLVEVTLI